MSITREVADVGADVVVRAASAAVGARAVETGLEEPVGLRLDPARDVGAGRAAARRVVLEPAVVGRVVGGREHDAVPPSSRLWVRIACERAGVGV